MVGMDLGCAPQCRLHFIHLPGTGSKPPVHSDADFLERREEFQADVVAVTWVPYGLLTDSEMKHLESWHESRGCCAFAIIRNMLEFAGLEGWPAGGVHVIRGREQLQFFITLFSDRASARFPLKHGRGFIVTLQLGIRGRGLLGDAVIYFSIPDMK
jgi:hypothetical protein